MADNFGENPSQLPSSVMHTQEESMSRDDQELHKLIIEGLYKAVRDGNLNETKYSLGKFQPGTWDKIIADKKETPLHIAVLNGNEDIVKELVNHMPQKSLEKYDSDGYTALITAAVLGNKRMVECMLGKHDSLISFKSRPRENLPIVMAIDFGQLEMASYLYDEANKELDPDQESQDHNGAKLLTCAIYAGALDIALALIKSCPRLALALDDNGKSGILALASMRHSFTVLSATCCYQLVSRVLKFFGIKQLSEKKTILDQYNELFSEMRVVISKSIIQSNTQQLEDGLVYTAICRAAKNGNFEFVSKMLEMNRHFLFTEENGRNIFMLGVLHRQEKIFSILYGLDGKIMNSLTCLQDIEGNNMLHMAGMIEDAITQINQIPGAALQMQRELQWFKEVERIVLPKFKETENKDGLTPRQLFTKNHADMKEKGEKWMKNTATSCTLVGTLIITIMFTAVTSFPGNNNQSMGLPKSSNNFLFNVFIISNALSLFSSSTSVLMFLGILTSRYSEEDFLEYLPRQMILGLWTLFCSIVTMMISFSSALFIILHKQSWIAIPLICLVGVPVLFFALIQFPILKDMFNSTYRLSIFDKKMKIKC